MLSILAVSVAYFPSLTAPFIFDDLPGIVHNPAIRDLASIGNVLLPTQATGTSVVGRPTVNFSLAVNYALGGLDPRGYHVFNLLIHLACGLLLFGLIRWTLLLPKLRDRHASSATLIAFVVAILWALHPIQTESVTCVIQRTESLVGLFYLLTVYGFVRGIEAVHPHRWQLLALGSCLLGMLTKEVMVSAPLIIFLYDRTFVSGSFREAWRCRTAFYLGLAASWVPLFFLIANSAGRGGTVGFDLGLSSWDYLLTQCHALAVYLKLSFWPHPLILDYGMPAARSWVEVWPQALLLLGIGAATLWGLRQKPMLAFLGVWFFAILAPSSSIVPLATQTIAEHRMYLPLASVLTLTVLSVHALGGQRVTIAISLVAFAFAAATIRRNQSYVSAISIWSDTASKAPNNPRAHYNLANALSVAARPIEAVPHYKSALSLQPGYVAAHYNLASAFMAMGQPAEAEREYEAALRLDPKAPDAHANLAVLLLKTGRNREAILHFEAARAGGMLTAAEHTLFGRVLAESNRLGEAQRELEEALRLEPNSPDAHFLLGTLLSITSREVDAIPHYLAVLRQRSNDLGARAGLADALAATGRFSEAIPNYEMVLRTHPNDPDIIAALERARRSSPQRTPP